MSIKILFQKLWVLKIGWDEELPDELVNQFNLWIQGLEVLKVWHIHRCYFSVE
jgi:hypothetical protein